MIGRTLSHYKILEKIGSGGMGDVYKAKDVRLGRTVAVKILPERLADSAERRERFDREARAISQLNHPRICTLYDVGSEGEVDYLVLEYIEGETLAERLKRGSLPREKVLEYGIQIAEGLEGAHRARIVHRDLKPANILLTKSGVKLLDFGLAKLVASPSVSDASDAPTVEKSLTKDQALVGTLPYMAPEQLEGRTVDARTDLWAFGAVLYEMVTGARAFDSAGQASLVASIMKGKEDGSAIEPPLLNELIRRCLSVDPEGRWASASDVQHVLSWIAGNAPEAARSRPRPIGLAIATLTAGLLAGWLASIHMRPTSTAEPRPSRMELSIPLPATDDLARTPDLAVSPDGRLLVYTGTRDGVSQLFRRSLDHSEVVAIPGTEDASAPFFSPDGEWLAFFSIGGLKKVAVTGGRPVTLVRGRAGGGGSWAADDSIVYVENRKKLRTISADGGPSAPVSMVVSDDTVYADPQLLPDGNAVVFTLGYPGQERVAVGSLKTGSVQVLTEGRRPRFSPTGHLLFVRAGSIWAVGFDPERLELRGTPDPIVEGVLDVFSATFDVSARGALFCIPETRERALVWVDREGRSTLLTSARDQYGSPRLSPDGTRVAVETSLKDIWVIDVERGSRTRLTLESATGNNAVPVWTPDGTTVTSFGLNDGVSGVYSTPADGSRPPEPILIRDYPIPGSWSPDGRTLAFHDLPAGGNRDILAFTPTSGEPPRPFLVTPFNERSPAFSPDGRWLAYMSDESGRDEVYVRAYPGPGPKASVSTEGGIQPVWSPDGAELFYRLGESMMVVAVETKGEALRTSKPRVLFRGRYLIGNPNNPNYSVTSDGQRFVMVQDAQASSPHFGVVLNWQSALQDEN